MVVFVAGVGLGAAYVVEVDTTDSDIGAAVVGPFCIYVDFSGYYRTLRSQRCVFIKTRAL